MANLSVGYSSHENALEKSKEVLKSTYDFRDTLLDRELALSRHPVAEGRGSQREGVAGIEASTNATEILLLHILRS